MAPGFYSNFEDCSLLGSFLPERNGSAAAHPEKGNGTGERSGTQVLWEAVEGAGMFSLVEENVSGRLHFSLQLPWKEVVASWGLVSSPR